MVNMLFIQSIWSTVHKINHNAGNLKGDEDPHPVVHMPAISGLVLEAERKDAVQVVVQAELLPILLAKLVCCDFQVSQAKEF